MQKYEILAKLQNNLQEYFVLGQNFPYFLLYFGHFCITLSQNCDYAHELRQLYR